MRRQQDLDNMQKAHSTPRCSHLRVTGERCGSPAMKGKDRCYYHRILAERQPKQIFLPPLEDGNSIQIVLNQLIEDILFGRIDLKVAALTLRALSIASSNLAKTTTQPDLLLQRALTVIEARYAAAMDLEYFKAELRREISTKKKDVARVAQIPNEQGAGEPVSDTAGASATAPLPDVLTEKTPAHVA